MAKSVIFAFILLVLFLSSSTYALSSGYPYLYKSTRAMGMGGAYVAIGGRVDSLFYNPAGLSNMPMDSSVTPKKGSWEVNFLDLSGDIGSNVIDFGSDLTDAFDTGDIDNDGDEGDDQLSAVNDVLAQYLGENLHLGLSELSSVGKNYDEFAFAVGGLVNLRVDGMTHQGFGAEGLLEMNADITYGAIGGTSFKISSIEGLYAGASVKFFQRESLVHSFTAREIVENQDNIEDYIVDELRRSGSAIGLDVGGIYHFPEYSLLRPAIGISILNIGDLNFGDAGTVPMTVNLGFSIKPEVSYIHSLIIGLDYIDLLNNYEQDRDFGKRLRFGAEFQILDKRFVSMAIRTGFYQGYITYGADLRLHMFTLSYVCYSEEIGGYAGQEKDARHLFTMNVGW